MQMFFERTRGRRQDPFNFGQQRAYHSQRRARAAEAEAEAGHQPMILLLFGLVLLISTFSYVIGGLEPGGREGVDFCFVAR